MAPIKSCLSCKFAENLLRQLNFRYLTSNSLIYTNTAYKVRFSKTQFRNNWCKLFSTLSANVIQEKNTNISTSQPYYTRHYSTTTENNLLSLPTAKFIEYLKSTKINRCFFVWNEAEQKILGSHPELKEIEDWLNSDKNVHYKKHEAIFLALGMRTNSLLGAFLWNTNRGQAVSSLFLL